ncbi:hypothetical protein [Lacinutrix jangbogonensis]|uniref:hypothetical protein n=1 Tax=Lacinutrix jangbogonensis TaxID=1469557 RepID=UPI00068FF484|nr:hypothetical protein [Lacinutrix jangbogonensis]
MKTTKTLITTTRILLLLFGCSKDDDNNAFTPTLPEATQTGKNTFGCYIDGMLLTPRDGTGSTLGSDYGMLFFVGPENSPYNELRVRDYKSGNGGLLQLHFNALEDNGEGNFIINESNCENGIDANPNINIRCRMWDDNLQVFKWYCSIENGGTINITYFDLENRIVSGTFSCSAQNRDDPEDIIEITQGRFDINRSTLSNTTFQKT